MAEPETKHQYNLNQGQQAAADGLFDFLLDPTQSEAIISGPAGTGKTYLMRYVNDVLLPRYLEACALVGEKPIYTSVEMTATTHKAAAVLAQSIGLPTSTIHSFIGLTVTNDFETGGTKLRRNPKKWEMKQNMVIFIDEASMIDWQLLEEIRDSTLNCKVIFVGDKAQLAPVGEKVSKIYLKRDTPVFELTEQMRNSGQPALMALCQQFRDVVETLEFTQITEVPGVIDVLGSDEELQEVIDEYFEDKENDVRFLAYTNNCGIEINTYVREMRGLPELFTAGEHMINVTPVHFKKGNKNGMIPAETEVMISAYHGEDTLVLSKDAEGHDVSIDFHNYTVISPQDVATIRVPKDPDHYKALMKYYAGRKSWQIMFTLKDWFADIRPRDASTVHKAQGSTHELVIVDLTDIATNRKADEVARMLYVAFSRPKHRIFLVGDLPSKYGGPIKRA